MSHQEVKDYLVELMGLLHIGPLVGLGNVNTLCDGDIMLKTIRAPVQGDIVVCADDDKRWDGDFREPFGGRRYE